MPSPQAQCQSQGGTWTPNPGATDPASEGNCAPATTTDDTTTETTSSGTEWENLGWTGDAASSTGIQDLLGQFFTTPGAYTQYFEDYDPAGEQAATQQMQFGQQQAQQQAQGSMWKQFEAGRQGRGGFGGAGRARQASMAGMFKGLETGREKAQLGLQEDIRGMHEQYRGDVMGQIGQLFAGGAEALSPEYQECQANGGTWNLWDYAASAVIPGCSYG